MEVEPNFRREITPCECGCGVESRILQKAWKDGTQHNRGCRCRRCTGRRSRKSGLAAQRAAARSLGVPQLAPWLPSDEELFAGELRIEVKSGAIVKPMGTAFVKAWKQSDAARAIGDSRPIVIVAKPDPHSKDGIIAFRESDLRAVAYALASNLGLLVE